MGEWQDDDENATRRLPPVRRDPEPDETAAARPRPAPGPPAGQPGQADRPKPPSIRDPWREGGRGTPAAPPPPAPRAPASASAPTEVFRPVRDETPATSAPTEKFRKIPATPVERPAWQHAPDASDRAGADRPAPDRAATDRPAPDRPAPDRPAAASPAPPGPGTQPGPTVPAEGRGRGRRFLIIGLVVLLVLAVVDRAAAYVAPGQIASQIKKDQQLPNKVDASIGGVPFLTQVLFGKYDDLGFTLHRLQLPGICVDKINAHLKGVHIPVTKILSQPTTIPIDKVTVSVLVDYADVNKILAANPPTIGGEAVQLKFEPDGNAAKVVAQIPTPIGTQEGGATVELGARDQQVTITVKGIDVLGASLPLPGPTIPVPLSFKGLPFDARLTGAKTTGAGLELAGEADHLTLKAPQGSSGGQPIRGC